MNMTALENEIVEFIKTDKVLSKHIAKSGYVSGSSTYVAPISIWKNEVCVLLENGRIATPYALRGVCKRIMRKFIGKVSCAYVGSYDGSCPRQLSVRISC